MNPSCRLAVFLFAMFFVPGAQASHAAGEVALVYSIAGEATLSAPAQERRPLRLLDRLPKDARIEVAAGSRVAIAFANGRRYELGERSRVTIAESDIGARSGPVRALPAVPPLPRLLAIADEEEPGLRAGAVRIRGERMIYPASGERGPDAKETGPAPQASQADRDAAASWLSLGNAAEEEGDPGAAEELYRRARALYEKTSPESFEMAQVLQKLGYAAVTRGDAETADFYWRRALTLYEKLDPAGEGVARVLQNLGLLAFDRRDLGEAETLLRQAVILFEQKKPDSEPLAKSLQNLGAVLLRLDHCAAARDAFQRSLDIRQKIHADDLWVARSLQALGNHAYQCEPLAVAESYHRKALAIREKLDWGGLHHATVLHDLGGVLRRQGRKAEAAQRICEGADLFESVKAVSEHPDFYDERFFIDCVGARVENGEPAEAFRLLERGRARGFLQQLAARDRSVSSELADGIAHERKELAWELDTAQAALARLSATRDAAEASRLVDRLRELRDEIQSLDGRLRSGTPRAAPEYLDLAAARRALDPGTVLLSYVVDDPKTYLFVVQSADVPGPGVTAVTLPAGREKLESSIRALRHLVQRNSSDPIRLKSQAARLYDLLIAPAEPQIAPAQRILISAHGPLHTLPFAVLVRQGRYLAEWKPLHSVLSATVYAEIRKRRPSGRRPEGEVVAFGDPAYPVLPKDPESAPAALREVVASVQRGLSLEPLPASRAEVEEIAALFPRARVYLGREATEERARSLPPGARIVHFATHGLLDERFPLSSALALTVPETQAPGQQNGLLQAWEILDAVGLDADLVTLSACDTALGKDRGGEGLIGLTRAFQYAGARSVLASVWGIADASTADFMKRFYRALRHGKPKDEALQAAQAGLIHSERFSHPYYWAAFQLVGDWE